MNNLYILKYLFILTCGVGKRLKASAYVLTWSVSERLMIRIRFILFALTMLILHSLYQSVIDLIQPVLQDSLTKAVPCVIMSM